MNFNNAILTLMLTEGCNFKCRHCVYDCSIEKSQSIIPASELLNILADYKAAGGDFVQFAGGEPTLCMDTLLEGIKYCASNGIGSNLVTNGWWGNNDLFYSYMLKFEESGLDVISLSFDEYHAEFNSWANISNILKHSKYYGISSILVWSARDIECIPEQIKARIGELEYSLLDSRPIANSIVGVGRAKTVLSSHWAVSRTQWGCSALPGSFVDTITVLPGKRVLYRCTAYNPRLIYSYDGDFTQRVAEIDSTPLYGLLKTKGLLPLMRKAKRQGEHDACEFCVANMAKVFPNDCFDFRDLPGELEDEGEDEGEDDDARRRAGPCARALARTSSIYSRYH
jgi:hypothetical protein